MADLSDLNSAFGSAQGGGMADLKKFLEAKPVFSSPPDKLSGRFGLWMANIERSIQGPYYFGSEKSYVDFFLAMMFQFMKGRCLTKLESKGKISDVFAAYPKAKAVYDSITGLKSAGKVPFSQNILPDMYKLADDAAATYK